MENIKTIDEIMQENQELKESISSYMVLESSLRAEIVTLNRKALEHETAVEKIQEVFNNLDLALKIKDEKLQENKATVESYLRALKLVRNEKEGCEREIFNLEHDIKKFEDQVYDLEKEIKGLEKQIESLERGY